LGKSIKVRFKGHETASDGQLSTDLELIMTLPETKYFKLLKRSHSKFFLAIEKADGGVREYKRT
jgi:hypothetical protein